MKVLFIGDIVGEPGRRAVKELVPKLRQTHKIDIVVANGENCAPSGGGYKPAHVRELLNDVDCLTSGDHVWDQRDVYDIINQEPRLLRPLNYPSGVSGKGSYIVHKDGKTLAVLNLQGRVFMQMNLENPFIAGRQEVDRLRKETKCILVDIHAETTSEKIAMGRFLDGHVSAVVGTHTHVATADEHVMAHGTAFICDTGMTGPHESILGREADPIIKRFLTSMPQRFPVAVEDIRLNAVLIDIDEITGLATSIVRICEKLTSVQPEVGEAFKKAFNLDA
ncbi:MAG: TIGR00282 family metallophosphoesterase [Verrucomicrobiota bacterium]|nr:TIGR00282 family metallophosphoesterase [Verrucomicrobiota bacterium]